MKDRELLYRAIKDCGYQWDAEKKILYLKSGLEVPVLHVDYLPYWVCSELRKAIEEKEKENKDAGK